MSVVQRGVQSRATIAEKMLSGSPWQGYPFSVSGSTRSASTRSSVCTGEEQLLQIKSHCPVRLANGYRDIEPTSNGFTDNWVHDLGS
jgi:hypothetical protein